MRAQLGNIVFEGLIGFNSWVRDIEMTYAKHALISTKPLLASPTQNLQTIKTSIQFHVGFCRPETEIDNLVAASTNGEILPLILANGRVIGDFVILRLSERILQTRGDGAITVAVVDIELCEYHNENRIAIKQQDAKLQATALTANNPNILRGQPRYYQTDAGNANVNIRASVSSANAIDRLVNEANDIAEYITINSSKILKYADIGMGALGAAQSIINGSNPIQTLAPLLPGAVTAAYNSFINIKAAMPITSINSVLSLNSTLQGNVMQMKLQNSPLLAQSIMRKI